jgi:O-methyltransferase
VLDFLIRTALSRAGYLAVPKDSGPPDREDMEAEFIELYERCRRFSMASPERLYAVYQAVRHVARHGIDGAIVECGVWRGGASMMAALTLLAMKDAERTLYLYDTFTGMPEPSARDIDVRATPAVGKWRASRRGEGSTWAYASRTEVETNVRGTGYPEANVRFVPGRVEDTIPEHAPDRIAVLRLDTDWYESTYHELRYLFPRLVSGGVLLLDDYGHWRGAREATDRYFAEVATPILLTRIDYTGRVAVKP